MNENLTNKSYDEMILKALKKGTEMNEDKKGFRA